MFSANIRACMFQLRWSIICILNQLLVHFYPTIKAKRFEDGFKLKIFCTVPENLINRTSALIHYERVNKAT